MKIFVNDESKADAAMMDMFTKAAELCVLIEREETGLKIFDPHNTEISLSFVSIEEIHELNRQYRAVDSPTDVLSFPMNDNLSEVQAEYDSVEVLPEELILGDVVICLERARQQAEEFGHSFERETVYLFTHSVLHLLGYDHMTEEDRREMRAREEEVLAAMDLTRQENWREL